VLKVDVVVLCLIFAGQWYMVLHNLMSIRISRSSLILWDGLQG